MRACLLLSTLTLAAACGPAPAPPPEELCPSAPRLTVGAVPPPRVSLNAYFLQEEATRCVRRGDATCAVLEEVLREAAAMGAPLVRTNAFNDDPKKSGDSAMQVAKLTYDETALRGLDLVLARAAAHGVRLVLPLGNHWDAYGGARQYVAWAGLPNPVQGDSRFYSEPPVVAHYVEHVTRVLTRKSTIDGLVLGAHPAVFAWELLNEPRGEGLGDDGSRLRAWVDEVAAAVKRAAPGALVGTGEEGFESNREGSDARFWSAAAPGWLFAAHQSFRLDTASPFVDFASAHLYPESWRFDPERTGEAGQRWVAEHAAAARALGKPLLLGEFGLKNDGLPLDERRRLYAAWLACAREVGALSSTPWMFADDARPDFDGFTFRWLEGTDAGDARNSYVDVVGGAR